LAEKTEAIRADRMRLAIEEEQAQNSEAMRAEKSRLVKEHNESN